MNIVKRCCLLTLAYTSNANAMAIERLLIYCSRWTLTAVDFLPWYGSYPCMFATHTIVKPIDIQSIKRCMSMTQTKVKPFVVTKFVHVVFSIHLPFSFSFFLSLLLHRLLSNLHLTNEMEVKWKRNSTIIPFQPQILGVNSHSLACI